MGDRRGLLRLPRSEQGTEDFHSSSRAKPSHVATFSTLSLKDEDKEPWEGVLTPGHCNKRPAEAEAQSQPRISAGKGVLARKTRQTTVQVGVLRGRSGDKALPLLKRRFHPSPPGEQTLSYP